MARFTGYKCDVCSKGGEAPEKGGLPVGWLQVLLPVADQEVKPEDRNRDICSGRCLQEFGKQRREVDEPHRPKRPSGKPAGQYESTIDPGLREFLKTKGFEGRQVGPKVASHVAQHARKDLVSPDCLVCEYETQVAS